MDVARAPMGYRDVPSGRASVAGEFARVARLHRARMSGQAFLVPFVAFDKRDSPEGAKQDGWANSERRRNTQVEATGSHGPQAPPSPLQNARRLHLGRATRPHHNAIKPSLYPFESTTYHKRTAWYGACFPLLRNR